MVVCRSFAELKDVLCAAKQTRDVLITYEDRTNAELNYLPAVSEIKYVWAKQPRRIYVHLTSRPDWLRAQHPGWIKVEIIAELLRLPEFECGRVV